MNPIPSASINDHLRRIADDGLHVLQGKHDVIAPVQKNLSAGSFNKDNSITTS